MYRICEMQLRNLIRKRKCNSRNRSRFPSCDLFHRQIEFNMCSVNHFVQIQTDKKKECVEIRLQSYESKNENQPNTIIVLMDDLEKRDNI